MVLQDAVQGLSQLQWLPTLLAIWDVPSEVSKAFTTPPPAPPFPSPPTPDTSPDLSPSPASSMPGRSPSPSPYSPSIWAPPGSGTQQPGTNPQAPGGYLPVISSLTPSDLAIATDLGQHLPTTGRQARPIRVSSNATAPMLEAQPVPDLAAYIPARFWVAYAPVDFSFTLAGDAV